MTLIAVIAVATAAILYLARGNSANNSASATSATSEIASANDTGPVGVMTEDPSCAPWTTVQNTVAAGEKNGWEQRDWQIPATAWTAEQRAQYEAAGKAMRSAADRTVTVAKLTPHRVMRELYEQSIAYWRAYADRIPNYTASDNDLSRVATSTTTTLGAICSAIMYGSAATRGPLVSPAAPPTHAAPPTDVANPRRFLTSPNPVCGDWKTAGAQYDANGTTTDWRSIGPEIPATGWTPEQKSINEDVVPVMSVYADRLEQLGRRSGNPILEDFAALAAQYRRALVLALPTYNSADSWLEGSATNASGTVFGACSAVGG